MPDAGGTSVPDPVFALHVRTAYAAFVGGARTQSAGHIRPLHQYIALRLVIEGGFHPDDVTPHPPLRAVRRRGLHALDYDPSLTTHSEQTVVGGLKSKNVDVVVSTRLFGPAVAVSVKGTTGAFRNLTNRMEEAVGDCTNLHIMYPGLCYGFYCIIKANRASSEASLPMNDVCLGSDGSPVQSVRRYHDALASLAGREFVRDDPSRYEAVAFSLIDPDAPRAGEVVPGYPPPESPLLAAGFFARLYRIYDMRFPYMTNGAHGSQRIEWHDESPALRAIGSSTGLDLEAALGYPPRLA